MRCRHGGVRRQARARARATLARDILKELIEINTTEAAEAMARRLLDAGFPEKDVTGFI